MPPHPQTQIHNAKQNQDTITSKMCIVTCAVDDFFFSILLLVWQTSLAGNVERAHERLLPCGSRVGWKSCCGQDPFSFEKFKMHRQPPPQRTKLFSSQPFVKFSFAKQMHPRITQVTRNYFSLLRFFAQVTFYNWKKRELDRPVEAMWFRQKFVHNRNCSK